MKMGHNNISARDIINKLPAKDLEKIFKYFGEEKFKNNIRKIVKKENKKINTEDLVK